MPITLYYHPLSQPSRAVLALLDIGGIKYDSKVIDLLKGQQKTPQYKAINPFGTVPCITHGDITLGESNAIMSYLCDTFPSQLEGYKGINLKERAEVSQYLSWYQGSFRPAIVKPLGMKIYTGLIQGKPLKASDLLEAEKKICQTFDFLDKILSKGNPYICGQRITIADLLIFEEATNVEIYKMSLLSWKNVNIWYNKVLEVKGVKDIHDKFRGSLPTVHDMLNKVVILNQIKLFNNIISQPCRAVMALLALGKIEYEEVEVDMFAGETRTPEYQKINKFSTVPALAHGNQNIGASDSILQYLCETFPNNLQVYYGATAIERAHVNQYLSWYQATFRPGMIAITLVKLKYQLILKKAVPKSAYDEANTKMQDALAKLNTFLSKGNKYLCGAKVTIADLVYFFDTVNLVVMFKRGLQRWESVKTWYNRMLEIPQIVKIHQQYKEKFPTASFFSFLDTAKIDDSC